MSGIPGLPTLRIDCDGPIAQHAKVTLDGVEVPGLTALRLDMAADDMPMVTLTIVAGEVDVSADALVQLTALAKAAEV